MDCERNIFETTNYDGNFILLLMINLIKLMNYICLIAAFMIQIFEWVAMLVLIHTQHKRRLEEIMWDYNNVNINDEVSDKI